MRPPSRTVLVTGATDGIGRALIAHLHAAGWRVVASGRRPSTEALTRLPPEAPYLKADLAVAGAGSRLAADLLPHLPAGLDALVHVAGVGRYGEIASESGDQLDAILNVNLGAAIELCHALYAPLLKARGHVLFVGSVAAFVPAPWYASYAASKAALDGLARSLRSEWRGRIRVSIAHPGAVATTMHEKAGLPEGQRTPERWPAATQIARRLAGMLEGRARARVLGPGPWLLARLGRGLPRTVERAMRRSRP